MGAFLGVAQASDMPPKFIHLTYKPEGTPKRKLAIVGKGLTFDSGGLNIKGAGSGIETMKMDMGGAAATLGAAKAIGQLKPDVEVHFVSAVTENMISGQCYAPR
jgi:leucyl aminopeptidase